MRAVRLHMASHIAEMQVTTSAFLIIVGFFVSWLPYACFSLWTMFNDVSEMSPTAAIIPPLFAKAAYVWNPLIYFGRNNDFRREFIDALMHSSNEERNVVHMVRLQECRAQEHLITLQEETEL
ncbi:green-sensitive opsin-2-like [Dreissena polymorpha]|uniref:G-protein coupled receptors family 1 profile domain-containing protein n=1 Tax=Dreissena polymorpha TaxID=45954 RepID=A0A9D4HTI5_DREPO|nr:green-sensitive opsin-2-like [Dreissena polymorpha]KAH3730779.1 hypothetical protein DPMN_056775 [Dreissena polymorpha]